jgi:hypothetical protein
MLDMEKLISRERHLLIVFCLVGTAWACSLFLFVRSDAFLISILPLQLLLTTLYTDYKVDSVKRELLRELGEGSSVPDSSGPQTAMKNISYKAIYLVIVGVVVIGIVWHIVHKLMISLE